MPIAIYTPFFAGSHRRSTGEFMWKMSLQFWISWAYRKRRSNWGKKKRWIGFSAKSTSTMSPSGSTCSIGGSVYSSVSFIHSNFLLPSMIQGFSACFCFVFLKFYTQLLSKFNIQSQITSYLPHIPETRLFVLIVGSTVYTWSWV